MFERGYFAVCQPCTSRPFTPLLPNAVICPTLWKIGGSRLRWPQVGSSKRATTLPTTVCVSCDELVTLYGAVQGRTMKRPFFADECIPDFCITKNRTSR